MDSNIDKNKDKDVEVQEQEEVVHYKLTMTHKNSKGLETSVRDLLAKVETLTKESNANIKASGPTRIPTKRLHITTRKSPCGNGTNTFDHFEMRIHKRVFHLNCSQKNLQSVVAGVRTEPGMILEVIELA